jgi:hypothetical protein
MKCLPIYSKMVRWRVNGKTGSIYLATKAAETKSWVARLSKKRPFLTIIISPSYLAHTMDKTTRANKNGELSG